MARRCSPTRPAGPGGVRGAALWSDTVPKLADPLRLRCGAVLPNRMLKSAMSEALGTPAHLPPPGLGALSARWARGGVGLLITGNVMIDRRALGEPGNVVLDDEALLQDEPARCTFEAWARGSGPTPTWVQLNHPGRQAPRFLNAETVAPSAVGFGPALARAFAVPRAMTEAEVEGVVAAFGRSAGLVKALGFHGVQLHAAHGYLLAQFLSPLTNQRVDRWGGPLEGRARLLFEAVAAVRAAVGPAFPVGVKLNSADFQRGGFGEDDALEVISGLSRLGVDLIEVSGGTYEAPAMVGRRASSAAREGYFLDFVARARARLAEAPTPPALCVTGGFRSAPGMQAALDSGAVDLVGLARPLCVDPDFPARALAGDARPVALPDLRTGLKPVDQAAMLDVTWYENQLARMAAGREPEPGLSPFWSIGETLWRQGSQAFKMRRAR